MRCVQRATYNCFRKLKLLKSMLPGDRENLGRAKIFGAQGFFFIAQGEKIYVKNGGENLKNNEHSSTR